ncbi:hypothetical protein [Marispirochaeta aestuarii]|uniref:Uncharacterized protein n=1 Tax=Marispirochaeta aestuarii TaxID=1963862 RepID=A0A1Y1RTI0_9SPIO|nr:hypothetical protein [Marispirochaeta aestuarii]ORC30743.1 hypothetical protein B4O97_17720 [Marispirochaeta aestuarii]
MGDQPLDNNSIFTRYLIRLLLLGIPVINVIASLLWGFAGSDEETRSFGRAALIVIVTFAVLFLIGGLVAFTFLSQRLFELIP